ncbi:MAG: MFS transporter [Balneolaceae bacterium]
MLKKGKGHILPIIVFAQFAGTSLWFSGNAIIDDLILKLNLLDIFIGFITMAVQSGFIIGTLIFAFLNIADRYSPVKVFLVCSVLGAIANLGTNWSSSFSEIMIARVFTGFFLAGIYPVGMKIASDWYKEGLGKALGYLVGALVLGTAFPHFLKYLGSELPWESVIIGTSFLAIIGGIALFILVGDGPFRKTSVGFKFEYTSVFRLFKNKNFRSSAFGYFGHMWELYTFWAFVPVILTWYFKMNNGTPLDVSLWSFLIIGKGGIGCAVGGHLSLKKGSKKVALVSLAVSGICCLLIPFSFDWNLYVFIGLMLIWGFTVIPDSPQFSTLVAKACDSSYIATGLTIVNCIGFSLTIISIQLVNLIWASELNVFVFWIMFVGPLIGLFSINKYQEKLN